MSALLLLCSLFAQPVAAASSSGVGCVIRIGSFMATKPAVTTSAIDGIRKPRRQARMAAMAAPALQRDPQRSKPRSSSIAICTITSASTTTMHRVDSLRNRKLQLTRACNHCMPNPAETPRGSTSSSWPLPQSKFSNVATCSNTLTCSLTISKMGLRKPCLSICSSSWRAAQSI